MAERRRSLRIRGSRKYDNILLDEPILNNEYFTFNALPVDCKLKVFSYLDHIEKGCILSVCKEWNHLLLHPSVWDQLSIWNFPVTCLPSQIVHERVENCYSCYKKRVHLFCKFILCTKPRPKRFEFKFNIGECSSGYLKLVESLMINLNYRECKVCSLNWKETPCRPYWVPPDDDKENDIMYRHRLRARYFGNMFDLFTKKATAIRTLVMPFDWCSRSVKCLTRLKNIHSLVLEKYFVFQCLDQKMLTEVLAGLPALRRFMLEVWTPSGPTLSLYSVSSNSVTYFDISQSRGFYLKRIDMPRLEKFRILRHPWNGPLVTSDKINIPCLYRILVSGAPNLCAINDHYLEPEWREFCYPRLDEVLRSVCSCKQHKTGWAM
ncbi:uncharacterized protein [Mytilus edulis]|nr:Hypothetical predicted protein [Mytilus galloprovincialis]